MVSLKPLHAAILIRVVVFIAGCLVVKAQTVPAEGVDLGESMGTGLAVLAAFVMGAFVWSVLDGCRLTFSAVVSIWAIVGLLVSTALVVANLVEHSEFSVLDPIMAVFLSGLFVVPALIGAGIGRLIAAADER